MTYSREQERLFKVLPKIDELLKEAPEDSPHRACVEAARKTVEELRHTIKEDPGRARGCLTRDQVLRRFHARLSELMRPSLRPVVSATGVVVHTNLGR